jgi:hypothetical protein
MTLRLFLFLFLFSLHTPLTPFINFATIILESEGDMEKTLVEILNERDEKARNGPWVPAHNGTEVPFTTRNGYRLLYCWQRTTGRHAYLNLDTDCILSDEEAALYLGM